MACSVRVRTGARLHFGLWGIHAPTGRRFGGVGMMIAEPGVELACRPAAEQDRIDACSPDVAERVQSFLRRLRVLRPKLPPVELCVSRAIEPHQGLGSGTQLGLATADAVLTIAGQPFEAAAWAHHLGRAERSSVGVHGFESGGFIVEAGQGLGDPIGELVGRAQVCMTWRIVLIAPTQTSGLSGVAEMTAFQQLPPMEATTTAALRQIAIEDWLPAMMNHDFPVASQAMWDYGQLAGEYFRAVQGGVFASLRMEELAKRLHADGVIGIAQTSWGPTIAVLCPDQTAAESLQLQLQQTHSDLSVRITRPLNVGAAITVEAQG